MGLVALLRGSGSIAVGLLRLTLCFFSCARHGLAWFVPTFPRHMPLRAGVPCATLPLLRRRAVCLRGLVPCCSTRAARQCLKPLSLGGTMDSCPRWWQI